MDYPGSDHRAQCMSVTNAGDAVRLGKTVPEGWSWIKTDKRRIREEAKGLRDLGTLATSEAIDRTIDALVTQLQSIVDLSIPRCKAQGGWVARWWIKEVQNTVSEGKVAWREYHRTLSQNIWERVQAMYKRRKVVSQAMWTMYWRLDIAKAII